MTSISLERLAQFSGSPSYHRSTVNVNVPASSRLWATETVMVKGYVPTPLVESSTFSHRTLGLRFPLLLKSSHRVITWAVGGTLLSCTTSNTPGRAKG